MSEMFSNYCTTRRLQTPQQFEHMPRTPTGRLNSSMEAVVKKQTRNQSLGFHGNWSLFTSSFLAMQSRGHTPSHTHFHSPSCLLMFGTNQRASVCRRYRAAVFLLKGTSWGFWGRLGERTISTEGSAFTLTPTIRRCTSHFMTRWIYNEHTPPNVAQVLPIPCIA